MVPRDFFEDCALICVDIQDESRGAEVSQEELPKLWRVLGFTVEDVNAAQAFTWETCRPNAFRVTAAARQAGLKMVFSHWGFLYKDGMDLDPDVYRTLLDSHGPDTALWPGHIGQRSSWPAVELEVEPGEYVMAKSGQDAFTSSNIEFLLRNLGMRNLVFIGGHTEACLGKTARSAKRLGFRTLCVEDATNNVRESTRLKGIQDAQFDYVVDTERLIGLLKNGSHPQ